MILGYILYPLMSFIVHLKYTISSYTYIFEIVFGIDTSRGWFHYVIYG